MPSDFLPPVSRWITLGGVFLSTAVGAVVVLAAVTPYRATIKATGKIRPEGGVRVIQSAIAGKVKSITVKNYQTVQTGDIIAYLNDAQLLIQQRQLQTNKQQNLRQLTQLEAQIAAVERKLIAETKRINSTINSARAELKQQQRQHQDRQITAQAEVKEAKAALNFAQDEYSRYRQLVNTGATSSLQLKEKEAALETAVARLDKIKTALNPSLSAIEIAQQGIAQEQAEREAAIASLTGEQEQLIQQQTQVEQSLSQNREGLEQVAFQLENTAIRTPITGTIQQLNLRNSSQVLQPGDLVAQIIPNDAFLTVKALVAPQHIEKIELGQTALMRISACPYPDYGVLAGKVTALSPDSQIEANRAANYEVIVQPHDTFLNGKKGKCQIKAGMESQVDIVLREETVLTLLLRKARLLVD
ncbi:MAG TPA: HlyD family efflux transporter periplasmic adaptor subunit [Coleofasciculaceae cyanobacterium]